MGFTDLPLPEQRSPVETGIIFGGWIGAHSCPPCPAADPEAYSFEVTLGNGGTLAQWRGSYPFSF